MRDAWTGFWSRDDARWIRAIGYEFENLRATIPTAIEDDRRDALGAMLKPLYWWAWQSLRYEAGDWAEAALELDPEPPNARAVAVHLRGLGAASSMRSDSRVDTVMKRLTTPVTVTLRHPRTGETEELPFSREMAAYAVRLLSYTQETASLVPILLSSAAGSDLAPLAAQFLIVTARVGETMAEGMGISVVCSEDFPFFEEEAIAERNRDTYLGALQTDSLKLVCPLWPRGVVPEDFKSPVQSTAPVLLLSGEADPVTPPENGELTAYQLGPEAALHLVANGQGHIVIHRGCIPGLASDFIESGSLADLDTSCVGEIAPQPFFLSYTGPTP
jgi:pimeloyl-ACP methyl ester carboxylesterase